MRLTAALLIILILAAFLGTRIAGRWAEIVGAVQSDIAFGPAPEQRLDICAPSLAATGGSPALVMIHGGAWRSGGRRDWRAACQRAAAAGVVGIAVDYRLANGTAGHSWPAQLVDVQLAMRWVRANAAKYGVDPNRICAIGDSSGGHLAVFLATLDRPVTGTFSDGLAAFSSQADCVIDWFGPVDMAGFLERSAMMRAMFVGVERAGYAEAERGASPLFTVTAHTAPILIAHGTDDKFIGIRQSEALRAALTREHIPNALLTYDGGHEFAGASEQTRVEQLNAAINFAKDPGAFLKTVQRAP